MHRKRREQLSLGGEVASGTRRLQLSNVGDGLLELLLTVRAGETVEVRAPEERDRRAWIQQDPGEGALVQIHKTVRAGAKIRVGGYRQFRVFEDLSVIIVEPDERASLDKT